MVRNASVLFVILATLTVPALWAEKAIIHCENQTGSSGEVPAYTAPGSAWVVENLNCNQEVSVLGFQEGYAKVQFGDKIGYVAQRYIRKAESLQDLGARVDKLEEEVREIRSQREVQAPAVRARRTPAQSQEPGNRPAAPIPASTLDFPRFEAYGGYSYLRNNDVGNLHGIGASGTVNVNRYFGLEGNFSWEHIGDTVSDPYIGELSAGLNLFTFLGGPRFAFRTPAVTPFVHALFGVTHLTLGASSMGVSAGVGLNGFTMGFGGGVDVNVSRHLAIRVIQAEYIPARFLDVFAHNYRAGAGIVAKF